MDTMSVRQAFKCLKRCNQYYRDIEFNAFCWEEKVNKSYQVEDDVAAEVEGKEGDPV